MTCGSENGTNESNLAVFSEDITFVHHFMAPYLTNTLPPYRSASGIRYTSKKLSKMVSNSASYSVYTRQSELP